MITAISETDQDFLNHLRVKRVRHCSDRDIEEKEGGQNLFQCKSEHQTYFILQ